MHYSDHDPQLLVWGVATTSPAGGLVVRAYRSRDEAEHAADQAPLLTITGPHPTHGRPTTIPDLYPLVYHHAEDGWTFAAIGWPVDQAQPTRPPAHQNRGHPDSAAVRTDRHRLRRQGGRARTAT